MTQPGERTNGAVRPPDASAGGASARVTLSPRDPAAGAAPASGAGSDEATLLARAPRIRLTPSDFRIGALQDSLTDDAASRQVVQVVDAFLRALEKGEIASRYLVSTRRQEIGLLLSYHLEKSRVPADYRIGKVKRSPDGAVALELRIFGSPGTSEGQVYLEKEAGEWRIDDIQVDWAALSAAPAEPTGQFEPSSRRWSAETR